MRITVHPIMIHGIGSHLTSNHAHAPLQVSPLLPDVAAEWPNADGGCMFLLEYHFGKMLAQS